MDASQQLDFNKGDAVNKSRELTKSVDSSELYDIPGLPYSGSLTSEEPLDTQTYTFVPSTAFPSTFLPETVIVPEDVENIPGPYRESNPQEPVDSDSESSSSESEKDEPIKPRAKEKGSHFPLPNVKLNLLGEVTSIIDGVVVIKSLPNSPGLDRGSALYFGDRRPMGTVYDIAGTVCRPVYIVLYENRLDPKKVKAIQDRRSRITAKRAERGQESLNEAEIPESYPKIEVDVKVGDEIYYADDSELSIKILTEQLMNIKAFDEGDEGGEFYSDDEAEERAKRAKNPKAAIKPEPGVMPRFKRNHLSQPVTPRPAASSSGPSSIRPEEQQENFMSYEEFRRRACHQNPVTQGSFNRPTLRMPPPTTSYQQYPPNMSSWQPSGVNFPDFTSVRFDNPPPMGFPPFVPPPQWPYGQPQGPRQQGPPGSSHNPYGPTSSYHRGWNPPNWRNG